jgi:hypothetical protein
MGVVFDFFDHGHKYPLWVMIISDIVSIFVTGHTKTAVPDQGTTM